MNTPYFSLCSIFPEPVHTFTCMAEKAAKKGIYVKAPISRHFCQVSAWFQGYYELVWHLNSGQGNEKGAKVEKIKGIIVGFVSQKKKKP